MILLSSIDEPDAKGSLRQAMLRRNVKHAQAYHAPQIQQHGAAAVDERRELGIGHPQVNQQAADNARPFCEPTVRRSNRGNFRLIPLYRKQAGDPLAPEQGERGRGPVIEAFALDPEQSGYFHERTPSRVVQASQPVRSASDDVPSATRGWSYVFTRLAESPRGRGVEQYDSTVASWGSVDVPTEPVMTQQSRHHSPRSLWGELLAQIENIILYLRSKIFPHQRDGEDVSEMSLQDSGAPRPSGSMNGDREGLEDSEGFSGQGNGNSLHTPPTRIRSLLSVSTLTESMVSEDTSDSRTYVEELESGTYGLREVWWA